MFPQPGAGERSTVDNYTRTAELTEEKGSARHRILGPVELALGVGWVSAIDTSKHWGKWLGRMTLIRLLRWLYCQPYCQSNLEGEVIDSPSAFFSGPIYVDPKTTAASLISIYGTRSHTRHFSV
jgi:hypothetical protein